MNYDVPVRPERIWEYFSAIQDLCGQSVSRSNSLGKQNKGGTVEVSAVKLGKFFILCGYDRRTKLSRLKAITTEEACGSVKHIQVLEEWLTENCMLITWKKIHDNFLPNVNKVSADPSIGYVQSPGRHILNASKYLGRTMVQLFQNLAHDQLSIETVQRFLDEVQWRERHGKNEEAAFWSILTEISRTNESVGKFQFKWLWFFMALKMHIWGVNQAQQSKSTAVIIKVFILTISKFSRKFNMNAASKERNFLHGEIENCKP